VGLLYGYKSQRQLSRQARLWQTYGLRISKEKEQIHLFIDQPYFLDITQLRERGEQAELILESKELAAVVSDLKAMQADALRVGAYQEAGSQVKPSTANRGSRWRIDFWPAYDTFELYWGNIDHARREMGTTFISTSQLKILLRELGAIS
jgi:hypothetical protein